MTLFFALVDGRPAFFDTAIHGYAVPESAVEVTPARHAELLDAQAQGEEIYAAKGGHPRARRRRQDAETMRASLLLQVKREAQRRIDLVSPQWRQLNDLRTPNEEGRARFHQIDAIRAASDKIESAVGAATEAAIRKFDPKTRPEWPRSTKG
jgi:hypothetical protein|tara:strand:+ start:5468 stop:5923 length:456 start_codon:yes stop_codon:yes gene_type:complete